MTDIIEAARRAIARHDAEAPSGVRYLSSALECVGWLRLIVEQDGRAVSGESSNFAECTTAALAAKGAKP